MPAAHRALECVTISLSGQCGRPFSVTGVRFSTDVDTTTGHGPEAASTTVVATGTGVLSLTDNVSLTVSTEQLQQPAIQQVLQTALKSLPESQLSAVAAVLMLGQLLPQK